MQKFTQNSRVSYDKIEVNVQHWYHLRQVHWCIYWIEQ